MGHVQNWERESVLSAYVRASVSVSVREREREIESG